MLKVDGLNFSYKQRQILKEIDLEIKKGAFIGIVGPNASGKSTLLKNMSKSLKADKNVIYLSNKLLNEYDPLKLAKIMAVVPQEIEVDFNFNVYDIIMMGRYPYQKRWQSLKDKDKKIVKKVMKLTDTLKLKNKKINELSGGEKQRVITARALAQEPEILLLDEPTSNLDINYQGEIYDLLKKLNHKFGLTIIVVSHDLNLTAQYCEKLILLKDGEIFAAGTAEKVLTEKNIKKVYKAEVLITENPISAKPFVTIIPKSNGEKRINENKNIKIHVISGGGTAKKFIHKLYNKGYSLTMGVLNVGDADWTTAKELGIKTAAAPPFIDISQKEIKENKKLIKNSDLIIVSDLPFGHGNIENLKLLLDFEQKPKILFDNIAIKKRDFNKGKAVLIWNKIIEKHKNIVLLKDPDKLLLEINKLSREEMEM